MRSTFDAEYISIHSKLITLKPVLDSIDNEIANLRDASTSADISKFSSLVVKGIDDAYLIIDDYSDLVENIKSVITKMDDNDKRADEEKFLNDKMDESDGPTALRFNAVSLKSSVSNIEKRFNRVLESSTNRVITLSRLSSNSITSIAPSTPSSADPSSNPSIANASGDSTSIDSSSITPSDTSVLSTIVKRLVDLETRVVTGSAPLSTHIPHLALPPIKLESFDGCDITKWPAYKYQLDSLILNQDHLNEVEKAFYVRSSLRGQALNLVSSIPTNENFLAKIVSRLEVEYSRKNLTQATLLHTLLKIRCSSNKIDDQISTVRSMINIVHTIGDGYGLDGLVTQLQLAERINRRFIAFITKQQPSTLLDALLLIEETLRSDLEELTITNAIVQLPSTHNHVPPSNDKFNKSKHSTADNNHSPKGPKIPICVFCGEHPYSNVCTSITSSKDRKDILRRKSLCHVCFSNQHSTADCSKKCSRCNGKHNKMLCDKPPHFSNNALAVQTNQSQRLFNVKAKVANPITDRVVSAHIHLDHGAQATLITRDLVNRLSLVPFDRREMTISGINSEPTGPSIYDIVNIVVVTDRGYLPIEAVVQDRSSVSSIHSQPLSSADIKVIKATLGKVPTHFTKSTVVHTDLLLSVGDTLELLDNSKETKLPCGFRLVESSIGPIVVGSSKQRRQPVAPLVSALASTPNNSDEPLEQKIERMFSVDPITRVYETTEKEARKASNEVVTKHFEDTVQKDGDEYVVQYSVKPEAMTELPSNFDLATSRLASTVKTLSKERSNLDYYNSIITDQLNLGQVEIVDPSDNDGIIHYLPHQPVLRPDKPTTPLRIVYDASAHLRNKPCLNDMIHPGPSDLEQIPSLLLRSRSRKTLIVADVEKAFLQVKLHPSQRNMLRFLWIKDLDKPVTQQNIVVMRFCVTPFGVNASPALLNKVIQYHIKESSNDYDSNIIHQLVSNIYVDNVIINVDHASSIMYTQSKNIFKTMSMNLRDYASNDPTFNSIVHESDRSKDVVQKLLGILWNVNTDQLSIKIPISNKNDKMSKRSMLSAVASPYDPLGLLNPLTLPPRLTIQSLWNLPLKWDETVDDSIRDSFHDQMRDLENFNLSIDRYSHLSECDEIILVAFSDASKVAMATCIYNWSPNVTPTLLISRTRLAPIKSKSTIPKMELDSLVMSHTLMRYTVEALRKEFPTKPIHLFFYSDSAVVLHWCKPDFSKPLGVFVSNRVKKIHETREELSTFHPMTYHHPRHVRSEHNPADHATRGLAAEDMNNPKHQWWTGPEWLMSDPNSWPNEELSSLQCPSIESFPVAICSVTLEPSIETVIDLKRFSSLRKAIEVTAFVNRFLSRCALKTKNPTIQDKLKHLPVSSSTFLTPNERRFAFNSIIRLHQTLSIHSNDSLKKKNLIIEDPSTHVWKANTRLTNSSITSEAKSPVFIPTSIDSTLARLIISDIHHSSSHSNIDVILNQVKRKYWIPRCRQIAKFVLKQCIPCRKTNNLPFRYPPSPVLPEDRVRRSLPFEHSGIDYAGPFHSNKDEKVYVIVITCLSTRLTHLELVDSLLPSSFILAFRRFCSRRGTPIQITSDKATTLKMSSTLFSKPEDDPNVNTMMSTLGIRWNFTTAHAPWKGGVYERLVKLLKDSLTRSIGRKKLSKDEFSTVVCEIEATLNSRPLTYVSSDDVQSFTGPVLRPIDLISPHSFLGCPIILSDSSDSDYIPPEDENSSRQSAIRQLRRSVETVDLFWQKWHIEYLTTLRDCSSKSDPLHSSRSTKILPTIGALCLVVDESGTTPRSSWKMAKILSLTETSATLKSHAGRVIERPLNLLIPLELHSNEPVEESTPSESEHHLLPPYEHYEEKQPDTKEPPNKAADPSIIPPPRRKKGEPSKMANDIVTAMTPIFTNSIVPMIAETVSNSLIPSLTLAIEDSMTVYTKNAIETRSSIHELTKAVNHLASIVTNQSRIPSTVGVQPHSIIPSIARTPSSHHRNHDDAPSTARSISTRGRYRSRSPRLHRRDRSRSPITSTYRTSTFKPPPSIHSKAQCVFCQSIQHLSKDCTVVISLSTRNSIMASQSRCKKCFRPLDSFHRSTCEPDLCQLGCVTLQGVPLRHCAYFCPLNSSLKP